MAREIEAPPSADDRMSRRAPRDKERNPIADRLKKLMQTSKDSKEQNMDYDEKLATADVKKRKQMMAKGGSVKGYKKGGSVSSCSKRADGIAQRGKTKCKMV
jgi:hypothetical protein